MVRKVRLPRPNSQAWAVNISEALQRGAWTAGVIKHRSNPGLAPLAFFE